MSRARQRRREGVALRKKKEQEEREERRRKAEAERVVVFANRRRGGSPQVRSKSKYKHHLNQTQIKRKDKATEMATTLVLYGALNR